jgi:hypothetical protein
MVTCVNRRLKSCVYWRLVRTGLFGFRNTLAPLCSQMYSNPRAYSARKVGQAFEAAGFLVFREILWAPLNTSVAYFRLPWRLEKTRGEEVANGFLPLV